ncbi:hypothetical protein DPS92_23745 [Salmonella enterica subsp. enterica serovar Richmond]|nr:hypothetical protein [Salmonella enterica subsp. enterica serovar Richmond]EAA2047596.1 hypothetical protein [Salmonella enterica subsp. enterica serovar Chester]EAB8017831.1 hypothetical protein [Salmonella enterica subsp. enterica serovar Newport]EAC1168249.1 hypothetical protein [Salmonella enterica subsp. enterica serovar Typhimurium]EAP0132960.1 hypothetical protein [Salmonella enterica]EBS4431936.1 hypothetical protein [Salmonella enterica subsp. enterica serovar Poona]EBZ2758171.1 h
MPQTARDFIHREAGTSWRMSMKSGAATRLPITSDGILNALKDVGSCLKGTAQPSPRLISQARRK